MKKLHSNPLLLAFTLFLSLGIVISSCKKDDDDDDDDDDQTETPAAASPVYPTPDGADGVLIAIETNTFMDVMGISMAVPVGTAVAVFPSGETFLDVGTVKLNNNELTKYTGNSYTYTPGVADTEGLDFSSVEWDVAGGNGIPAISHTVYGNFPEVSSIEGDPSTVSTSSNFTLETESSIQNADSVIFSLLGSATVQVTKAGNVSSHTFSTSDMSALTGSGYVQVTAYSMESSTEGGKTIYYVNESVVSSLVTFQ